MSASTTADRGFTWSDDETSVLLKLWGANDAQSELTGNKRNFVVYEKISEKMNAMGFARTASQCREKIKRMKREYTLTKQYNSRTAGPKKLMRFYDQFEHILMEKQNKNQKNTTLRIKMYPGTAMESDVPEQEQYHKPTKKGYGKSEIKTISRASKESRSNIDESTEPGKNGMFVDKDVDNLWAPAVVLVEGDQPSANSVTESCNTVLPASCSGEPSPRKKRKIATKLALFQSMMDSLTLKFMKYQEESDLRFISNFEALEDKRKLMEDNVQKMWMEFEERRRKDEQEHELNILSTFNDILNHITVKHSTKDLSSLAQKQSQE